MKHSFVKKELVYTGTCGDSYCGGHHDKVLHCSCGTKITVDEDQNDDQILLEHRLEYLETTAKSKRRN